MGTANEISRDYYYSEIKYMNKISLIVLGCVLSFATGVYAQEGRQGLDLQAHRGGRGLLPENSIPAMLNAVALGARTLELDCVISADRKVVVSHDPFISGSIMQKPDGSAITKAEEKTYAIYTMSYDSIRRFPEGVRPYPQFPRQQQLATYKPLLADLIDSVEAFVKRRHLKPVYYNMETKSDPAGDDLFHPKPEPFVSLIMDIVQAKGIAGRVTIQSFDPRTLQVLHRRYPDQVTALLVENKDGLDANITRLGFVPTIYSPYYPLVNKELVKAAHDRKIAVLPWTVNEETDMRAMTDLGVDGIISDYPDRLVHLFGSYQAAARTSTGPGSPADQLPARVTQYTADIEDLQKVYIFKDSPEYFERFRQYNKAALSSLQELSFHELSISDQVDYILLQKEIRHALLELDQAQKTYEQVKFAVPFAARLMEIQIQRRRGHVADATGIAQALDSVKLHVKAARLLVEKQAPALSRSQTKKIIDITESIQAGLKNVYTFYNGYDPAFTWWVKKPYQDADTALNGYVQFLLSRLTGDNTAINPIGEDKLKELLQYEMVAYGPKDLVEIANRQFAWCEAEMKKASAELGFGDNWKAALEKVKLHHPEPGKQPEVVNALAEEAIQFIESRDLVTIPPLAKEAWRMFMLTPEEQRYAPFFLGGESILVGYPTEDMDEATKVGSMRSNNYGFSHATVFHELIPGHNLQGFMDRRYKSYRGLFSTPFSVEGWALYWEMLLWDKGFQKTPEEKIGALFWRMHRCARIIFSLNYHLGKWTPQQCIDFLIERVGHEKFSAESEVRRSFSGGYGPLYQIAYMMGGLQLRALHHEWVDSGKMTDKAFHDAFLHENSMPIEMFRATISGQKLAVDYTAQWKFADDL